jgi:hypothetical protein
MIIIIPYHVRAPIQLLGRPTKSLLGRRKPAENAADAVSKVMKLQLSPRRKWTSCPIHRRGRG